ncbi:MAG: hypothetical protein P8Y44_12810 [Acidobacteriota bacterium]
MAQSRKNLRFYSVAQHYRGRVYRELPDAVYPGWYVQFFDHDDLRTVQLHMGASEPLQSALIEAAGYLGCKLEELQIEGEDWDLHQGSDLESRAQ